jgi:hypothetical protein
MILLLHPDSACFCKPDLCVETLTNGRNLGVSRKQFVPVSRAYSNFTSRGFLPCSISWRNAAILPRGRNLKELEIAPHHRHEPAEHDVGGIMDGDVCTPSRPSSRLSRASAS